MYTAFKKLLRKFGVIFLGSQHVHMLQGVGFSATKILYPVVGVFSLFLVRKVSPLGGFLRFFISKNHSRMRSLMEISNKGKSSKPQPVLWGNCVFFLCRVLVETDNKNDTFLCLFLKIVETLDSFKKFGRHKN